jgi:hypothetical protein
MTIKLFDTDKKTPLNLIDYEDMGEILSKWLQITVQIKKATINNEKFTYKTKCVYSWLDKSTEETEVVENQKAPLFNYSHEHMVQVDAHIISRFQSHQLIVQVLGMIKSREPKRKFIDESQYVSAYETDNASPMKYAQSQ